MVKKTTLGRGLSALMPEDVRNSGEQLLELDIDMIEPNCDQPRTRFTDDKLEELAQSIRENGVIQPILVRRKGGRFEIVAGERRWRSAQKAGLRKIPAILREVSDEKLLELALIENIQRQELNAIEEARAYQKLIKSLGLTQEMVAVRVGKDRTFITNYLRLLRLPEDVQTFVAEEKISVGHARALLAVSDPLIQAQIARSIMDLSLSVRETERAVKRIGNSSTVIKEVKPVSKDTNANIKAAEIKLKRRFGTNVKILPNGKGTGGKLEIEFYGEADLDRLFQLLMLSEKAEG